MTFTLFQTLIIYLWFQYDFLQEMLRRIFLYEFMDVQRWLLPQSLGLWGMMVAIFTIPVMKIWNITYLFVYVNVSS
jgi:hypothetical protein